MKVTFYQKPDGRAVEHEITKVRPEDAQWFKDNGVRISMEDIGDQYAVYADCGLTDEEGEPNELLVLSAGRSCEDTLSALRAECEAALREVRS